MDTWKITKTGNVVDRATGRYLGWVTRSTIPRRTYDPRENVEIVVTDHAWEARPPGDEATVNPWSYGNFGTRREAAEYLASRQKGAIP
jgi:hypothetical protein